MEEEKEETEMSLLPAQWCCPNTCAVWSWQVFTVGSDITGFPCWEPLHLLPTDPLPLHQFLGIHTSSFSTKVYHSPNIQHEQDLGSLHTKSFHPQERPVPFHGSTPGAQASSDTANFPLLHCGRVKAWFSLLRFSQPDEILIPLVLHQHSEGSSSSPRASVRAWFPLIRKALLQPTKSPLQKCLLSNIYVPTFFPQRKAWQPTPVFLSGESHGQRSLVGYSPYGCKEVGPDWSDLACTASFFISRVVEGIKSLLFMWMFDRKQQHSIKQWSFN